MIHIHLSLPCPPLPAQSLDPLFLIPAIAEPHNEYTYLAET